ncbi:MAG: DNA-binding protein [Bacilli bacterium]|jgi:predicted DNA-binding protein YlxM (UPF0122 family)|nr:DNA-binding protein [Bacilli bacterium]
MIDLKQQEYYHELFDLYHSLLTTKQQAYFNLYFFEDLSLAEIAENENVSRNAIHLNINKTIKYLLSYEQKLQLYHKYQEIVQHIEDENLLNEITNILKKSD